MPVYVTKIPQLSTAGLPYTQPIPFLHFLKLNNMHFISLIIALAAVIPAVLSRPVLSDSLSTRYARNEARSAIDVSGIERDVNAM